MNSVKILSAFVGVAILNFFSLPVKAALMINSQSALVNLKTQEVLFTINFSEIPDFESVDRVDRQADSFQYFIEADGELPVFRGSPYYSELEAIIRGEEIHLAGDIRIRNAQPWDINDPSSGGWGSIRGSVPFSLLETALTFSVPLQLIGDWDGRFSYNLESYEFGALTDGLYNQVSVSIPEPLTILGTGVAIGFSAYFKRLILKKFN